MGVKVVRRGKEPIQDTMRRLKKLMSREGIFRELRKRENFVKPCEKRRAKKLRKQEIKREASNNFNL